MKTQKVTTENAVAFWQGVINGSVFSKTATFVLRYGVALVAVAAALLLRKALTAYVGETLPTYITFYPAIMVVAVLAGFRSGMFATVLTVIAVDYWIASPKALFFTGTSAEIAGVILFFLMGVFLNVFTELYRRAREKAAAYEKEVAMLESQNELRQQREWLRVTLSSIGEAVLAADTNGRITLLNPTAEKLTGWTQEECQGKEVGTVLKLIDGVSRRPLSDPLSDMLSGAATRFVAPSATLLNRNGREIAIELEANPIANSTSSVYGVVTVFKDVTQKRQDYQELHDERDFVSAVLDSAAALVVVLDSQGCIQRFNKACEETSGWRFQEARGKPFWSVMVRPEEVEPVKAAFAQLRNNHLQSSLETDSVSKAGEHRRILWTNKSILDDDGQLRFIVGTGLDLTRERVAETEARKLAEQHRLALQAGKLGTWDLNLLTGEVFWDERCRSLFGISHKDPIDYKKVIDIIHEKDRHGVHAAVQAALDPNSNGAYEHTYRVARPDGTERWVAANGQAHFQGEGPQRKAVRFVGTVRDATADVQAEERARNREQQFRISAVRTVIILAASLVVVETGIMITLSRFPAIGGWWSVILDSATLLALLSPVLYFFAFRPLVGLLRQREQVEEALRRANDNLEERVKERTAKLELEVSERKLAEESLRRSQEDLAHAQAVAHVGSWRLNLHKNELVWSDENWSIFGISRDIPLTYETFLKSVHPDDRAHVDRSWNAALRGESYDIEHRILVGNAVKWVRERAVLEFDSQGVVIEGFGTTQDITGLKQAQNALTQAHAELEIKVRERTARLRQTVDRLRNQIRKRREAERKIQEAEIRYRTVADFTYDWEYWRTPQGTLFYCSPSCERVTGYTADDFSADRLLLNRIILPEDLHIWEQHEKSAFADPAFREIQFRIQHKNGEIRWIDHSCRMVIGGRGETLGIRASNRDVTERKKQDLETERLREELGRFSRITVAGQLAAAIAHELNQPLGAVLCNAKAATNWLRPEQLDLAEAREALEDIQSDCRRAGGVIQRLRSLFQRGQINTSKLQFNDIIRETLELVHSEFLFRGISVQLKLEPDLALIEGCQVELQQVILNLVINAAEAITASYSSRRSLMIQTTRDGEDMIHASISDSGPGITQDKLARIFEPFFTTKTSGMGMGLAISYSIIEEHRGKLWAANNPDGGAIFHLTLPVFSKDDK